MENQYWNEVLIAFVDFSLFVEHIFLTVFLFLVANKILLMHYHISLYSVTYFNIKTSEYIQDLFSFLF